MRWQDYRRSDNVEEGSSSGPSMFGGGLRLSATAGTAAAVAGAPSAVKIGVKDPIV